MQFSSRLTLATHILLCIEEFHKDYKVTSTFLAGSTNANPVNIRKILGQLKEAGLIKVEAGVGGATILADPKEVTLLTIFNAVEVEEDLFHFHENPSQKCPVGNIIHGILDSPLEKVKTDLEKSLDSITLQSLIDDMKTKIENH